MTTLCSGALSEGQRLAWDTVLQRPTDGIGIWLINPMEWEMIDRLAGLPPGSYVADPKPTYRRMLQSCACCMVDQWIPDNPLSMGRHGYEGDTRRGATTGAEEIVVDGLPIREPEDVVRHMESVTFPRLREAIAQFDGDAVTRAAIEAENAVQDDIGPEMLKCPYGRISFPGLAYGAYGYECYFMAHALYPEVMEQGFKLQGDLALLHNRAVARAYREGGLPPYCRLDHDMADARGTLINIKTLDRIWFPHFARCLKPLLDEGVRMIWHCDGNLMAMAPRLLDVGLVGFQGFQYEQGMDYERICSMKTRDGEELLIIAGVSVTTTLPFGTPDDVRREMAFLVEHGPRQGLFLGASSSITPGVPWENLAALQEGFRHFRASGRSGP